jgi:hypothetical protein
MAFDLTEYLAKRDGAFEALPTGDAAQYLTPKQRQVAESTARKNAQMSVDAARKVEIANINTESVIGKLDLDPNSLIGTVVNKAVATVNTGVGLAGQVLAKPLEGYAALQEAGVSADEKAAFESAHKAVADDNTTELHQFTDPKSGNVILLNNYDGDTEVSRDEAVKRYTTTGDNAVIEVSPDIAADINKRRLEVGAVDGVEPDKVTRLTNALEARRTAQQLKDATNFDSAVAIDRETGERTSGLQRRLLGDGALKLASGLVGADESLVGLASLVSGGEAGKAVKEAGFDFPNAKKVLASFMTPEQQLADKKTQTAEGFSDTLDAALSNPSTIAGGIAESVPSMMLGGLIGRGVTAVAPAVSAGVGGAIGEGVTMAGQQAENIRNQTEDGRLTLKQSLLAAGTGVLGAAVGVAGNKLAHGLKVSDVDEAVVRGAVQDAERGLVSRATLSGAIEGGEELLQSSGEQVVQNVALDKPFDEGVGNAAAMGLVTGAPLGAGTAAIEHVNEKAGAADAEQTQVADFQAAVDKADPSVYLDPKTKDYAPDKAVAVLFAASQKDDVIPEVQAQHLEQAQTIVADLESQVEARKAAVQDATPEGLAQLKTEHEAAVAAGNEPLAAALQQGIVDVESLTPEQKTAQAQTLTKLTGQLDTAKQVTEQLGVLVSPKAADVEATVQAAATELEAAQKVLTLAMHNPDSLSSADLTGLINDEANGLSTEQRSYLRQFDEARIARNALQTRADVHAEVLQGTAENMGLVQYQTQVGQALATGNTAKSTKLLGQLEQFALAHQDKFRVARAAYEQARNSGQPVQVLKSAKGWEINTGSPLAAEALTANGGLEIRGGKFSRPLVQNIQAEAKAIVSTYKALSAAAALPVQKSSAEGRSRGLPRGQAESTAPLATSETQATEQPSAATEPAAAATVEESTVAEIQDAPEATTGPTEQGETGALKVFQGERAAETNDGNYKSVNLVRQFFTQSKDATVSGLSRPLVAVKDFMQQTVHKLADFAPDQTLTVQQEKVLALFKDADAALSGVIDRLLPKKVNPEFSYAKPLEFFMDPETGELEANVKTAINAAVFSWVNEHGRDLVGSPQHISRILNWDKDKRLSGDIYKALGHLGTRESLAANSIGQAVLQTLGIKALDSAPQNERARIEAGVGQFAIAVMLDWNLIQRQAVTKGQLTTLGAKLAENANLDDQELEQAKFDETKIYFVAVNKDNQNVKDIIEASTGSQNILDKVFATGNRTSEPRRTAPDYVTDTTQNTDQPAPQNLIDNLNQLTKKAWRPIQERVDFLLGLPPEMVEQMIGVKPVDETLVHKDNRAGLKAKNDALIRDRDNAFEYLALMQAEEQGLDQDLFMEYSIWKHHRVGMTGNVLNPQTSKVHRWLVGMTDWTSTIDPRKSKQANEFLLQVGAGLGVKIDKQNKKKSLQEVRDLLETDVMQDGMAALHAQLSGETLSTEQQQAIVAAVQAGKENLHSFAVLMEMVQFDMAKANKTVFTSKLMGEVDGVTNGPMLSQILFGTITQDIAEKGGFYAEGASATDYPTWRGQDGNQDFYETLANRLTGHLIGMPFIPEHLAHVFAITGDLSVNVDRNIVKRPLTAVNYGSTMAAAIDGMADDFIGNLYGKIEKLAALPDRALASEQLSELLGHVSAMLKEQKQAGVNTSMSIEDAMNNVLSGAQEAALKKFFAETVGVAMEQALNDTLSTFIERRDKYNGYGRLAFDLYNLVYQHMRESYIAQNLKGSIASTVHNKKDAPLHDLTAEQEALIRKRLAHMEPLLATSISNRDGKVSTGVKLADSGKALSDDPAYSGQLSLGDSVPTANGEKPVKTMRFRGFKRVAEGPGVSSVVNGVQSTDSGIISQVYAKRSILNIHDAGGSGINEIGDMAKDLNQSTFDNLLAYSPPQAMADTLKRVLLGLADVMQDNADSELTGKLSKLMKKNNIDSLAGKLQEVQSFAHSADQAKLAFLAEQQFISQYGLAGHSYEVTEANKADVAKAQAALVEKIDTTTQTTLSKLGRTLMLKEAEAQVAEAEAKRNSWGEVGRSGVASDPGLVQFFTEKPERTAGEVFSVIAQGLEDDVQGRYLAKLLKLLARSVNPDLKVTFITPETPFDGQDMTQLSNALGWFNSERGIFVKSPAFARSGLTAELLMHELVHGVVAQETENPSTPEAQAMVKELEQLLNWAKGYMKGSPALMERFKDATSSVHELIAYGLTNKAFQDQVLRAVKVPHKSVANSFITGMKRFIDSIAGLLFHDSRLSQSAQALNGLTVLIENASGLFAATQAKPETQSELTLAMNSTDPLTRLASLSTQELFDYLASAPAHFVAHLKNVQLNIADKLHGPFGVIKAAIAAEQALTPNDRFIDAIANGRLPYASAAQVSGVAMSAQESFVFEQVEAVTLASIDNTGSTTVAYRELGKLYEEAKAKLTPADIGQAAYDYVFTAKQGMDGKSDYLARFAAMSLAYEPMAKAMQFSTKLDSKSLKGLSFWESVQAIFERILETLHSRLTHTQPGQIADAKLMTLIEQLVSIEAKRRTLLAAPKNGFNDIVEAQTRKLNDAVRRGLTAAADSSFVKQNRISAVRALGAVGSTVFGDRLEFFVEGMQRMRDQQFKQRPGMVMGLFNEIRGSHAGNLTAHELLRATNNNERLRKHLISDTEQLVLGGFANGGTDLSKAQQAAITQGALRTDLQSLLDLYSQDELEQLVSDPAKLKAAIAVQMAALKKTGYFNYYQRAAKDLAYYMATGRVRTPNLVKNVQGIAELFGTRQVGSVSVSDSKTAQKVLDPLVSLLALHYTDGKVLTDLAQVFRVENARGNESGMQLTLRMHRELQNQARERLFEGSEGLMIKGYVPEVFNPHITLKAANAKDGLQLQRLGYAKSDKALEQDKADPYAEEMHLYRLEDGGLKAYVTGIFSTTGLHAKGNTVHSGEFDMQGQTLHAQNQRHSALIERKKAAAVNALFSASEHYEPGRERGNHLAPVFNAQGEAVNYAYLMTHETKDVALERDNSFASLLGKFAGSTFDKQASADQNKVAVQALHDQYLAEYATMPERYLKVGPTSPDASLREAYKLLPKSTQQAIQDVWGTHTMLVRSDLIDMNFGYRKFSLSDMFAKQAKPAPGQLAAPGKEVRNALEQVVVDFWSFILADRGANSLPYQTADGRAAAEARAGLKLRQAEDIWQEIISEIKDILVVKSGLTLLGNVLSNFSELFWIGVPLKDIVKHHRIALRGVTAYRKDAKELFKLQQLLATGTLVGSQHEMQQRIIQLEDSIARSPVKELIDAGLLPTIVEDVAQEHDEFSYKSRLVRGAEQYTDGLNKHIKAAGRTLYMAHDTALYQWLSQGTQVSDFLARYTAYQHMTHRENAPMDHKTAVQFVSDAFVNYDIPTHRSMQYLNDMGIIWFTKYYLRIQKVIMHLWKDNPARALMLLGIDQYFAGAQTLMDSGFMHHLNNPLSIGALKYPGTLDDLATVNAMMSPFKGQ